MHEDIDEDPSIFLRTSSSESASVIARVPTEGEAPDVDGVMIRYLLHVIEGRISELEIYKDDGSRILRQPEPEEVTVDGPPYAG